jgi:hypothetical protein
VGAGSNSPYFTDLDCIGSSYGVLGYSVISTTARLVKVQIVDLAVQLISSLSESERNWIDSLDFQLLVTRDCIFEKQS